MFLKFLGHYRLKTSDGGLFFRSFHYENVQTYRFFTLPTINGIVGANLWNFVLIAPIALYLVCLIKYKKRAESFVFF